MKSLVTDLDFDFPPELVAHYPFPNRDEARMLVGGRRSNQYQSLIFKDLPKFFKGGDVLVINDSQVFPCRLIGTKASGGRVECFLLEEKREAIWTCLIKGTVRVGTRVTFSPDLIGEFITITDEQKEIRLVYCGDLYDLLNKIGHVPLPPYIKRADDELDRGRYQTIYAKTRGSVAAPTAGFHFTPHLLEQLKAQGVIILPITLHVGLGTFLPIRSAEIAGHNMHTESYFVPEATAVAIRKARHEGGSITAVGTTSVRTLESAYDSSQVIRSGWGKTNLFIHHPYPFQLVDRLLTNFHQPRSTLLALVQAFMGPESTRAAYAWAIAQRYRLFSYGDCMLVREAVNVAH